MDTSARLRLYQYEMSPYCITAGLILQHSGIPYEVVNLPLADPSEIIKLTQGAYYQVPVLVDLFNQRAVYDAGPAGDDIARFLNTQAPLMNLFPEKVAGLQRILVSYIENDCESVGFKVNDAHRESWLRSDLERGLHRRHKERKFGPGCLEAWTRDVTQLSETFFGLLWPFEQMLGLTPFLTGDQPVYADYALAGVLGNFLFSGVTQLPAHYLMLEAWYTKMRAGQFRNPLDELHLGSGGELGSHAIGDAGRLADTSDLDRTIPDLKLRPGSQALDVDTGFGHAAAYLAEKGFVVTAADTPVAPEARALMAQRRLVVAFQEHGAEQLPYADSSFHLIVCRGSAHYLKAPEQFVGEATRVLKTYGFLLVIDTTLPDDHVEASAWMNQLERLRDPAHVTFPTPNTWRNWCALRGLTVTRAQVETVRVPDLQAWLAELGAPADNRKRALEMVAKAPPAARELFKIGQEGGKIVWTARRLTLIAGKM